MRSKSAIKRELYYKYHGQGLTFQQMLEREIADIEHFMQQSFDSMVRKVKKSMYHKPDLILTKIRTENYDNRLVRK